MPCSYCRNRSSQGPHNRRTCVVLKRDLEEQAQALLRSNNDNDGIYDGYSSDDDIQMTDIISQNGTYIHETKEPEPEPEPEKIIELPEKKPVIEHSKKTCSENEKDKGSGFHCPVCLETFKERNSMVVTSCSHTFCLDCFLKNMEHSSACPLCRTHIKQTDKHKRCLPSFRRSEAVRVAGRHWHQYFTNLKQVVDFTKDFKNERIRDEQLTSVLWAVSLELTMDTAQWFRENY